MRVLSLDTTTAAGSVALVVDDRVALERRGDSTRTFAERLPDDIMLLLDACGVPLAEVDVFAVACGPGSFTGLRIGIATIQGLAFVLERGVVAVSAIEALAHAASVTSGADIGPATIIAPWMDARRGEVFSALYRVAGSTPFDPDRLVEIEPPAVGDPAAILARWNDRSGDFPEVFIGDGAVLYENLIRRAVSTTRTPGDRAARTAILDPPPLAGAIGRIAAGRARRGEVVPAGGVRPLYVRRPDAEIARDKPR